MGAAPGSALLQESLPSLVLPPEVSSFGFVVDDYAAVIRLLSELKVEGAPERAVDKRRAEFLAGRLAAVCALRALGVDASAPGRKEDGSPRWPAAVVGSITHGAGRALCAAARAGDVAGLGIDLERLMDERVSAELRRRICFEDELGWAARLALPEHQLVSLAFSAKESLYKCLYPLVGKFMDLHAARIVDVQSASRDGAVWGELSLELSRDWSGTFRRGMRFAARFHVGAAHVETAVLLRP